ncbi:MAG: zinc ribbon domain-containing protein [Ruminococcaceae bacterium]|nr:zinc ribbon domain-containing protein [Oscillospiraceae bacterium]MBR3596381.1 DUF4870 domain-containing protein [Clostridia bacterium]
MTNCSKCSTVIPEGVKVCPGCGEVCEIHSAASPENTVNHTDTSSKLKINAILETEDSTAEFEKSDIDNSKMMALFSYLGPLVLIPIFAAKNSPYAKFHANQGLLLLIAEIAYSIGLFVLTILIIFTFPKLSFITSIFGLVNLAFFVLAVIGILNTLNGKAKELPIIGRIRILK